MGVSNLYVSLLILYVLIEGVGLVLNFDCGQCYL